METFLWANTTQINTTLILMHILFLSMPQTPLISWIVVIKRWPIYGHRPKDMWRINKKAVWCLWYPCPSLLCENDIWLLLHTVWLEDALQKYPLSMQLIIGYVLPVTTMEYLHRQCVPDNIAYGSKGSAPLEVWAWISNVIPHFIKHAST